MDSVTATLSHLSSRLPGPLPVLIVAGLAIGLLLYVLQRNHPNGKTIEQHLQRATRSGFYQANSSAWQSARCRCELSISLPRRRTVLGSRLRW